MNRIGIACEPIEGRQWGIGRIITNLLAELAQQPALTTTYRFVLYFKDSVPTGPWVNNPLFENKVVWQPFGLRSFVLYHYVFLPLAMLRDRITVGFYPDYMLPLIHFGKSIVFLTEDAFDEMRSPAQKFRHRLAYRVFINWAAKHATKIIAFSESSKNILIKDYGIQSERLSVCHLGIKVKVQNSQPVEPPYILYVGQAFPRRHLRESLQAFGQIAGRIPGIHFIAIGQDKYSPPCISKLIAEINTGLRYEAIKYYEYVSDEILEKLYREAALFVYISAREAFGLPPVEALAQGVPPLVCDTAVTRELFGNNAFFVKNPDDVNEIAQVMQVALQEPARRQKISQTATEIREKFTWQKFCDAFLKSLPINHG